MPTPAPIRTTSRHPHRRLLAAVSFLDNSHRALEGALGSTAKPPFGTNEQHSGFERTDLNTYHGIFVSLGTYLEMHRGFYVRVTAFPPPLPPVSPL